MIVSKRGDMWEIKNKKHDRFKWNKKKSNQIND